MIVHQVFDHLNGFLVVVQKNASLSALHFDFDMEPFVLLYETNGLFIWREMELVLFQLAVWVILHSFWALIAQNAKIDFLCYSIDFNFADKKLDPEILSRFLKS